MATATTAERDPYRRPGDGAPPVEVAEWDVVLMHGTVRVMGRVAIHMERCVWQQFGAKCDCLDSPRISSPVLGDDGEPLEESWWSHEPTTGQARHLLDLGDGDELDVESGKRYRLLGGRRVQGYDSYACGSIFLVYPREDERARVGLWARLRRALGGRTDA